VIQHFTTHR